MRHTFLLFGLALALDAGHARAQEPSLELTVALVGEGPPAVDLDALDDGIARALRAEGFARVVVPPLSFAELSLAAGCVPGALTACLDGIARATHTDAVVLRRVQAQGGALDLQLVYRDPRSADPETRTHAHGDAGALASQAEPLVRRLFGEEPAAPNGLPSPSAFTWTTLIAGAALLTGGAVLGASAAWGDHASLFARTRADVDRIESAYADAQARALAGDVLLAVGGGVLFVGIVTLVYELSRPMRSTTGPSLAVGPSGLGVSW